jgi:hypothetical protein
MIDLRQRGVRLNGLERERIERRAWASSDLPTPP